MFWLWCCLVEDRELLLAYVVTIFVVAAVAYFTKRILREVDPYSTGLKPPGAPSQRWLRSGMAQASTDDSAASADETVTEYPQSGIPGRWQWRSE